MYQLEIMTQSQAEEIAFNWHYDGDYSFYDMEADEEDLEEFIDPAKRGDSKYAVMDRGELIGFFSVNPVDDQTVDIALGMRPDLTGHGKGLAFLEAGIEFVQREYEPQSITLSVETFNQRAINVYRTFGFRDVKTFMQHTNGSVYEFLKMEYEVIQSN
ncbi:GNAT family N-acetyltransferase [Alkalibacillus almallahensis]|uniref:GNAT family N-acetyltransferase n=1 Tax=Alkalibacillus almallahensis TaxID=1379154 RepID=UPI001FB95C1E|nr:GNAT family protein [Alkalibacillus almallahensis]NIK12604.1 ribosomal-protein-alanine N-acetyltransferase [Alkalibacillus almallahensis]